MSVFLGLYIWVMTGTLAMLVADGKTDFQMTKALEPYFPSWLWPHWALVAFWPAGLIWYWRRWR